MKESEIEESQYIPKKNLSIGLTKYPKIKALSGLNFQWKIQLLFALFGVFSGKKDPKLKDQEVRDQVSTTFSEAPQWDLTFGARISLVAHCSLLLTGTPFSYFWQLFLPTPVSYSYHLLVTSSRYYFLLDQLLLLTNHLSYYFRVLLSGNIITNSYRLLASTIPIRYFKKWRYRAALEKRCSENM